MKSAIDLILGNDSQTNNIDYKDHNELLKNISKITPNLIEQFPNMIIYGSDGFGKYTFARHILKQISPSDLKYQKTVSIQMNKNIEKRLKISDIHYEIDLQNMIYNTKTIWEEMYYVIQDIISSCEFKKGIILIKNFHYITNELMDIFQSFVNSTVNIKYILLSEHISFIPEYILNLFSVIPFKRCKTIIQSEECKTIIQSEEKMNEYICKKNIYYENYNIVEPEKYYQTIIQNFDRVISNKCSYIQIRNFLYETLIYQLNIYSFFYYLLKKTVHKNHSIDSIHSFFIQIYPFFYQYNNNYRPIYHLEKIIYHFIEFNNELS